MIDVQKGLGMKNISDLVRKKIHGIFTIRNPTKEQIRKYKRSGKEWFDYDFYIYVRNDLMSRITKNCIREKGRGKKIDDFRIKLGFKPNDIPLSKEHGITTKKPKLFKKEKIRLQHKILNYYIDLYFIEYKLAIEIDEKDHLDRKKEKEQERKNKIRKFRMRIC